MTWRLIRADVMDGLGQIRDRSVQCVVTSPPYWGLRDYGAEGQIGLEPTIEEHVEVLVCVFREVRRVLRDDGVLWLNYGDAYAGNAPGNDDRNGSMDRRPRDRARKSKRGLAAKNLLGLPWRVAFALQADGWILRSDVIWHKPNPMPESATDRPTRAHEYVFLLSKSPRYFYDADAVREPTTGNANPRRRDGRATPKQAANGSHREAGFGMSANQPIGSRNLRSVWSINPQPFAEAHFATFPEKLAEMCILAGTSARGCCPKCGAPWRRVTEKGAPDRERQRACGADASGGYDGQATKDYAAAGAEDPSAVKARILAGMRETRTVGWQPTCECRYGKGLVEAAIPCTVLDPFAGSGTTLLVAERLSRDSIGIELNDEYANMAERRIRAKDPTEDRDLGGGKVQRSLFSD